MATEFIHRGGAAALSLSSPIASSGADPFTVAGDTAGWPSTEGSQVFVITIDRGTGGEERMLVTRAAGSSQINIVQRGSAFDLTGQSSHDIGAIVEHTLSATELSEYSDHRSDTGGTHGVAGAIVGTTDTQTLSNKTIDGSSGGTNTVIIDQSDVNGLPTRLTGIEADVASNVARLDVAEPEIDTLQSDSASQGARITVNEGDINALQTLTSTHADDINALQSRVTVNEGEIAELTNAAPDDPATKGFRVARLAVTTGSTGYVDIPWASLGISNADGQALAWVSLQFSKTSTGGVTGNQPHFCEARVEASTIEVCVYGTENSGAEANQRLSRYVGPCTVHVLAYWTVV